MNRFQKKRQLAPAYMMIYSPGDKRELEVVKQIMEAAIRYLCCNEASLREDWEDRLRVDSFSDHTSFRQRTDL